MTKPKLLPPGMSPHGGEGPRFGQYLALVGIVLVEVAMFVLLGSTFSETMALMGDVFLCDQPLIGIVFCALDPNITASHLLAWLLAVFSIFIPVIIWNEAFKQRVFDDIGLWLSNPTNRVYAIIAAAMLLLIVVLETINLYTLVARQTVGGPFQSPEGDIWLLEILASNQLLGVFVALLVSIMNTALAFVLVMIAHNLKKSLNGGL